MQSNKLQTTTWDNSQVYKNFQNPKIQSDLETVVTKTTMLESKMSIFRDLIPKIDSTDSAQLEETIPLARESYRQYLDMTALLFNIGTYAHSAVSVNSLDYAAKDLSTKVTSMLAKLNKTTKPLSLFLQRSPETYLNQFLKDESVNEMAFALQHQIKQKDYLLSNNEEVLLEGHSVDGYHAWAKLYSDIAGSMKVQMNGQELDLATASNSLFQGTTKTREVAYRAINQAWQKNEIPASAILNSIYGWRLENYQARSSKKELHYLDQTCHGQKISRKTLDALMNTTFDQRHIGHQAINLMAQELGVTQLGPWDLLAPYPHEKASNKTTFPEAMEIVIDAFKKFDPDMADFAKMMFEKRWIDSTPSSNRASGAYCTGFAISREPRVFITYDGSQKNIITLAHEIGHAYHNWVMKDLKLGETRYPSTLAETASIFAETLVRDAILENSKSKDEKKAILWQDIEAAATFLINIPARFEFEKRFLDLRKNKVLNAPEIKELCKQSWKHWYGDTLTEQNEMFWASKLHFSMSYMSFYNYPYLFGYLFSLGIYAKKQEMGAQFKKLYLDILKDTGRMTAEDLIQKHLKEDITSSAFWMKPMKIVEKSVNAYKALI